VDEFRREGAVVVVVGFVADAAAAAGWLAEVPGAEGAVVACAAPGAEGSPPGTAGPVYAEYGLSRSVAGVWGGAAAAAAAGRRLPPSGGLDIHQLGGDFVVDPDGRIAFAHYSRDNLDRPDVGVLIAAVQAARRAAAAVSAEAAAGGAAAPSGDRRVARPLGWVSRAAGFVFRLARAASAVTAVALFALWVHRAWTASRRRRVGGPGRRG
jgi:hypothetical protein